MTKLTIILDAWDPIIGGGQKLFKEIIKGLINNHNYQVTLITRSLKDDQNKSHTQNQSLLNNRFKIIRLGPATHFNNLPARLWFTFHAFFVAVKQPTDLFLASSFLPGFTLQLLKLTTKTPKVLVAIGFGAKSRFYQLLEKLITQTFKYDLLITDDYQFFRKVEPSRKTKFIVNGVSLPSKSNLKKRSPFTFIFVGRDEPRKGIPILKEAFKLFQKEHPQAELKLFGPGHNPVSKTQLHQAMSQSHCLVLPSLKEGHPLILFEAFSYKLPVIATKVGSVPKFITPKNGYLIKPNNVNELVKAMKAAYQNQSLSKLGQNGYQLVKNQFTWQKTVNNYHQALKNLQGETL